MTALECPTCAGHGDVRAVRWAHCCVGFDLWNEVFCGCGGSALPEDFYAPCPLGCAPPASEPDDPDPHYW